MHIEWSLGSGFFDWAPETQVMRAVAGLSASCSQVLASALESWLVSS